MTTVFELTTNPKYDFNDLKISIIDADSNNEVNAFVGQYSNPNDIHGQGLIDLNNLLRHSDCPSVSDRRPSKRPDGYVVAADSKINDVGYVLFIKEEKLSIRNEEEFREKVSGYGFNF